MQRMDLRSQVELSVRDSIRGAFRGWSEPDIHLSPGQSQISLAVRDAAARPLVGHRTEDFRALFLRVQDKILRVFGVETSYYAAVVITGSGTAANETMLRTARRRIGPSLRLLVVSNGEFGERLRHMAADIDLEGAFLPFPWGEPIDLRVVERELALGQFDALAFVWHETSTGMLNPVLPLARLAQDRGMHVYVDGISAIGAVPFRIEESGVTLMTASANKAIGSYPGRSLICGKRPVLEELREEDAGSTYLNLASHFRFAKNCQTPNTPAELSSLDAALDELLAETVEGRFERFTALAKRLRQGLRQLGLALLLPEEHTAPFLTTASLPGGLTGPELLAGLKEESRHIVYAGKGELASSFFQVANMGALTPQDIDRFLRSLRRVICNRRTDHAA